VDKRSCLLTVSKFVFIREIWVNFFFSEFWRIKESGCLVKKKWGELFFFIFFG